MEGTTWIEDLKQEVPSVRQEIRTAVNRYCGKTRTKQADAWRRLYQEYERQTKIRLDAPKRLDYIEAIGGLSLLLEIAGQL